MAASWLKKAKTQVFFFFLIPTRDNQESHTKKGKGEGIAKIEGSGRKEGGEEKREWLLP